jgi:hypothetical protein
MFVLAPATAACGLEMADEPGEGPGQRAQKLGLRPEEELALGEQAYTEVLRECPTRRIRANIHRESGTSCTVSFG